MALVRSQVKALDSERNCGLIKRGRGLLQRTFSFSDAHAVTNSISSYYHRLSFTCQWTRWLGDVRIVLAYSSYIMPLTLIHRLVWG